MFRYNGEYDKQATESAVATNPNHNDDVGIPEPRTVRESGVGSAVSPQHRAILEAALARRESPSFNEILASIPELGLDSVFERNRA
jgi:hypothetical protein